MLNKIFWILNYYKNIFHTLKLKNTIFGFIGKNVQISSNFKFLFPSNILIQDHVYIGPNATIYAHGKVVISRGTIIGPNLTIYTANHNFSSSSKAIPYDEYLEKREVVVLENVWIGGNVILLPGAKIGEGVIVGAGAVIAKEIAPYSIVIGNPCRVIGKRDIDEYINLKNIDSIYLKNKNMRS